MMGRPRKKGTPIKVERLKHIVSKYLQPGDIGLKRKEWSLIAKEYYNLKHKVSSKVASSLFYEYRKSLLGDRYTEKVKKNSSKQPSSVTDDAEEPNNESESTDGGNTVDKPLAHDASGDVDNLDVVSDEDDRVSVASYYSEQSCNVSMTSSAQPDGDKQAANAGRQKPLCVEAHSQRHRGSNDAIQVEISSEQAGENDLVEIRSLGFSEGQDSDERLTYNSRGAMSYSDEKVVEKWVEETVGQSGPSESISNQRRFAVEPKTSYGTERVASILMKVAEHGSAQTGKPRNEILDQIVADTIALSIPWNATGVDSEQANAESKLTKDNIFCNDTINPRDSGQENVRSISNNSTATKHSPNAVRLMTNIVTPSRLPPLDFKGKEINLPLPQSWREIPVKKTNSGSRLGSGWTELFAKVLSSNNKECCWVFLRNYVQVSGSRKNSCSYWQGTAKCKMETCPVTVKLSIKSASDNNVTVIYAEDPKHDIKEMQSRRITGAARKCLAEKFADDPRLKPGTEYSKRVAEMDQRQYSSGNRTGAGRTSNAIRIISSRAKKGQSNVDGLETLVSTLRKEIRNTDVENARKSHRAHERKFFGYVQEACVNEDRLRIILMEEDVTRMYHKVAKTAFFHADATGGLFRKVRDLGRILYYALVLPHPFGQESPIPVVEMITNEHSTESIRAMFRELRSKEASIYPQSGNTTPLGFMSDFSLAIINAALKEFNNETYREYLDRTYKIMIGEAKQEDLQKTNMYICTAHMMQTIKKHAVANKGDPLLNSKQHLAMRFFGRLIKCTTLKEATALMIDAYVIFNSKKVTMELEAAIASLTQSVNTFESEIEVIMNESEEYTIEQGDDSKCVEISDSQGLDEKDLLRSRKAAITTYWKTTLEEVKDMVCDEKENGQCNKYYNPQFVGYLIEYILPSIALWSNIMTGNFGKFSKNYKSHSVDKECSTNGVIERYFGILKQDKTKPGIDGFIKGQWDSKLGRKRTFVDGLQRGFENKKRKTSNLQKAFMRSLNLIDVEAKDNTDFDQTEDEDPRGPEESWSKPSPRSNLKRAGLGRYQQPPKQPLKFDPVLKQQKKNITVNDKNRRRSSAAFKNFKKSQWPEVTKKSKSSFHECNRKLIMMWQSMGDEERNLYEEGVNDDCACGRAIEDAYWVQCDMCDSWYHTKCAEIGDDIAEEMPYFHCKGCVVNTFREGMNYVMARYLINSLEDKPALDANAVSKVLQDLEQKGADERQQIATQGFPLFDCTHLSMKSGRPRGIENGFMNCWLNSVLQIVCGSPMRKILPVDHGQSSLIKLLQELSAELRSGVRSPVSCQPIIQKISRELNFSPDDSEQLDVADGFTLLASRIAEEQQNESPLSTNGMIIGNLKYCGRCKKSGGGLSPEYAYRLEILRAEQGVSYSIEDLLWNSMACTYEFCAATLCQSCKISAADSKLVDFKFFLCPPVFLPISINRVNQDEAMPVDTRIEAAPNINMCNLIGGWNTEKPLDYTLCAWIVWKGQSIKNGHYVAFVRDGDNSVWEINDSRSRKRNLSETLQDSAVRSGVKLLIYARTDCFQKEEAVRQNLTITLESILDMELILKGDQVMLANSLVSRNDLHGTITDTCLNGQTIDAFLSRISTEENKEVLSINSYVFTDLLVGKSESRCVSAVLKRDDLNQFDLILMPIHLPGTIGHYSIMGIYPRIFLMIYADSLRTISKDKVERIFMVCLSLMKPFYPTLTLARFIAKWTLVSTNEVEQQKDSTSCGIYCCLNAYRMKMRNVVMKSETVSTLHKLRYWINTEARMAQPDIESRRNQPRRYTSISNKFVSLDIKSKLPRGYLLISCGRPRLKQIERKSVFKQIEIIEKCSYPDGMMEESSESDDDEPIPAMNSRSHEFDAEILTTCATEIENVETFSSDSAIVDLDSERVEALIKLPRELFRNISDTELGMITSSLRQFGIEDIVRNTAWRSKSKWLSSSDMMDKTCRLGDSLTERILIPELFTLYVGRKFGLRRTSLIQEVMLGNQGQSAFHPFLKLKEKSVMIKRKSPLDEFPAIQVVHGRIEDENVGAVIRFVNQYCTEEDKDMWIEEQERQQLLQNSPGRLEAGNVFILKRHHTPYWNIIVAVDPIFDASTRERSISLMTATLKNCLQKAEKQKLSSVSLELNATQRKKWPVKFLNRVRMQAVEEYLAKKRSFTSIDIVRFTTTEEVNLYELGKNMKKFIH